MNVPCPSARVNAPTRVRTSGACMYDVIVTSRVYVVSISGTMDYVTRASNARRAVGGGGGSTGDVIIRRLRVVYPDMKAISLYGNRFNRKD